MSIDSLDDYCAELAKLACQTKRDIRNWVMVEANKRHIRPLTFARERLRESRTWSPTKLLRNAQQQGRLKGVDYDYALLKTKAVSRCARKGGSMMDNLKAVFSRNKIRLLDNQLKGDLSDGN
jgi:hypothetical protein